MPGDQEQPKSEIQREFQRIKDFQDLVGPIPKSIQQDIQSALLSFQQTLPREYSRGDLTGQRRALLLLLGEAKTRFHELASHARTARDMCDGKWFDDTRARRAVLARPIIAWYDHYNPQFPKEVRSWLTHLRNAAVSWKRDDELRIVNREIDLCIFDIYWDAIQKLERLIGKLLLDSAKPPVERFAGQIGEADGSTTASSENVFRLVGDRWEIRYQEKAFSLNDRVGLRLIAMLLAKPFVQISALDLEKRASAKSTLSTGDLAELPGLRLVQAIGDLGPVADENAIKAAKDRLHENSERRAKAEQIGDQGEIDACNVETEKLEAYLSEALGISGSRRRPGGMVERARIRATNAISRAMKSMEEPHRELWKHLTTHIHGGKVFAYTPDPPISWDTD